jgi:hypothetical protein
VRKNQEVKLFVVWRHPRRAPFAVGELSYDGVTYRFRYDRESLSAAFAAGFKPSGSALTRAFPDYDKEYESPRLFPVFAGRLPDSRRPDYAQLLARFHLQPDSDPFEILTKTRARLATDDLGVERDVTLSGQLSLETKVEQGTGPTPDPTASVQATSFRCHVVGWQAHGGDELLGQLSPGAALWLERDQANRHDPNAIAVMAPTGQRLGYLPVRYSGHVAWALSTGWRVTARLVEVQPPPNPPSTRATILVEISGRRSHEAIREILRRKGLPRSLPGPPPGELEGNEPMVIGPAPGKICSACEQKIEPSEELAFELRYPTGTHWFHEECFKIWDQVRRESLSGRPA